MRLLPALLLAALGCAAPPRRPAAPRDVAADAAKGCANLSVVLDNWRFAITAQLRTLLLADHASVLPDYGRIRALSAALDGLHRDVGGLKQQLGRLSGRFADVEAAAERLGGARRPRGPPRPRAGTGDAQGRRHPGASWQ